MRQTKQKSRISTYPIEPRKNLLSALFVDQYSLLAILRKRVCFPKLDYRPAVACVLVTGREGEQSPDHKYNQMTSTGNCSRARDRGDQKYKENEQTETRTWLVKTGVKSRL